MHLLYTEFSLHDSEVLTAFLSSERWPFHSTPVITAEKIRRQVEEGYFTGAGKKTFWIVDETGNRIGVIRLFDLGSNMESSETPLFDIKISQSSRNEGAGEMSVKWLTDYVFNNYPNKNRLEGTTRFDNAAMRRVFEKCGFAKEAHYRRAWPDEYGNKYDCVGYSILRQDWEQNIITPVEWNK